MRTISARYVQEIRRTYQPLILKVLQPYLHPHDAQGSRWDATVEREDLEQEIDLAIIEAIHVWRARHGRTTQFPSILETILRRHLHRASGIQDTVVDVDGQVLSYHQARRHPQVRAAWRQASSRAEYQLRPRVVNLDDTQEKVQEPSLD
ncbi:hypothetical protein [Nitrospira sp. Kam-Ns4a]